MNPFESPDLAALAGLGPVALWLIAVGFISPPVIAVIQQSRWSARRQSIVAFVFYLVVAAVTAWLNGIFTTVGIVTALLVIFVTGATTYKNLWKPTGVTPAIENATPIGASGKHVAGSQVPDVNTPASLNRTTQK
ncbi:membrane protein [Arthrobacter phage Nandita]|uniref:Membrane protein n=1 Tax=Arthrobacter phage Nandita TaxID=2419963 RepID=A0A3G2KI56_9CAUD|nr:membrane protein [Arthrobacter phage Nandita]AYN58647.1 membrane protein [Arthrobacter phage Nandita]